MAKRRNSSPRKRGRPQARCECGRKFVPATRRQAFCSQACRQRAFRNRKVSLAARRRKELRDDRDRLILAWATIFRRLRVTRRKALKTAIGLIQGHIVGPVPKRVRLRDLLYVKFELSGQRSATIEGRVRTLQRKIKDMIKNGESVYRLLCMSDAIAIAFDHRLPPQLKKRVIM